MTNEKKGKGFFVLDMDQFFKIQDKGLGIEEAATYLALMKGTDQTNTISRGGVNSVMEYTGLARSEAKRAIDNLARVNLVEKLDVERVRAKTVPRFKLHPHEGRSPLTALEASVVAEIEAGMQPTTSKDKNTAFRAQQKGWIEKLSTGWAAVPILQQIAYVPNMFVDMQGQTSPLGRLVQIGEVGPVMLAAELYHRQDLMNEKGIPSSMIRAYYRSGSSVMAGSTPSGFRLHHLVPGRLYTEKGEEKSFDKAYQPEKFRHGKESFWSDLKALDAAHVTEWAIYSANGKPSGEYAFNRPQRPLGVLRGGKHVQSAPEADAAFVSYMMWYEQERISKGTGTFTAEEMGQFWRNYSPIIAVENAHVSHVEGIGILRMVYRADTENTGQWFRDLHKERQEALFFLDGVRKAAFLESFEIQSDRGILSNSGAAISK
jgi:hypothetical protein